MIKRETTVSRGWSNLLVETGRVLRFGIVGIAATLTYAGATALSVEWLKLAPVPASILGQIVATGVSYFGHAFYSFRVRGDHRIFIWRFFVTGVLTFTMNGVVTWLLTSQIGMSYRVSVAIVTVLIPLTNYVGNRFWVFLPGIISAAPSKSVKSDS